MIFQFEQDFVGTLRCIPMAVRLKLDQCGIKLKLHQWLRLSREQRQSLIDQPITTPEACAAYRAYLIDLIETVCQETASAIAIDAQPAWDEPNQIPDTVLAQAEAKGVSVSLALWQTLTPLQRFAMIKLSRSSHENSNFAPAVQEFTHTAGSEAGVTWLG